MWRRTADAFGVIVACPSSRYYGGWSAGDRDRILGEIAEIGADYRVDSSRIYVVGYSSGANFAYRLMVENPGLFKGVAPYAGRLTSSNRALATLPLRDRTRVCVFHGSLDTTIPIQHAVRAVTRLRRAGFDGLTPLPGRYRPEEHLRVSYRVFLFKTNVFE